MIRLLRLVPFAAGIVLCAGCSPRSGVTVEPTEEPVALRQTDDLLHMGGSHGRPPTQLTESHHGKFPLAYEAIKKGEIIVLWGAPPKGEGEIAKGGAQEIIAYEKNVPTEGGFVLLSAGTIKHMTASEFAAAPKSVTPR